MNLEDLPELVERAFTAVVEVEVSNEGVQIGSGSGFLAQVGDQAGPASNLIVTNAHVAGGGSELEVRFRDQPEMECELVGVHPMVDIALLRIGEEREGALEFRGGGELKLGEFVIALGHPLFYSWTATSGLLSGLDRPKLHENSKLPITMVQTSADINHGNSGGPLIGLDGRVAGVNTSGHVNTEVLFHAGFAVPGHSAHLAALSILEAGDGDVPRPWTGIPVRNEPWKAPKEVMLSLGIKGGARVDREPEEGSPAEQAGLREGDVVIGVDDSPVDDPGDLYTWMLDPGCLDHECEVKYLRDGKLETTAIRPVDRSSKE